MGFHTASSTLFVPGTKGLSAEESDFLRKKFPDTQKLDGGVFTHNGIRTNYYVSRAGNEKKIIVGFSGANAQFPLNLEEIKKLNAEGCTLICMALPRVGPDFMKRSEKLMRAFLTDPNSPASVLVQSDAPQFIATHSSSGPIVLKLLGEEGTKQKLKKYIGVEFLSPIFDVPYASRDHSYQTKPITLCKGFLVNSFNLGPFRVPSFKVPLPEITIPAIRPPLPQIFERYADHRSNVPITKLWFVKAYLAVTAKNESFVKKLDDFKVTLGQVREIQKYSREVMDNFDPANTSHLRTLVMAGDNDPFTCWKTTESMAARMGAQFHKEAGGGHDLVKDKPALLDKMIEEADKAIAAHRRSPNIAEYVYVPVPMKEETIPLPAPPLGYRARLALQRSASSLYSFTGLL